MSSEYKLTSSMTIISHADRKGNITLCNDDFLKASGYSREEVIGKPHNILRHPDMPKEAFRDLWDTIQRGKPWSGIVKNRRKDGDFYWVRATVTPLPDKSGYTSVRVMPTAEEVSTANALYTRIANGERITIHEGRVVSNAFRFFSRLNISQRLLLMVILPTITAAGLALLGIVSSGSTKESLRTVYEDRMIPIDLIAEINDLNQMSLIDLVLAEKALEVKGDPRPHLEAIKKNQADIEQAWAGYMSSYMTEHEKTLAADHLAKRNSMWQAIEMAAAQIAAGNAEQASISIQRQLMGQLRWPQEESIDKLKEYQVGITKDEYDKAIAKYETAIWTSILLSLAGILAVFIIATASRRYIVDTLQKTSETALAIARGNLLQPLPPTFNDEVGDLVSAVAIMRNSQHETIATLRQNSDVLGRYSSKLNEASAKGAQTAVSQYEAVTSMVFAIEKLAASFQSIEDIADNVNKATKRSSGVAIEGGNIIHDAAEEMRRIANTVNTTAESIVALEGMSQQITTVVNVIKAIADQTNLLALNAAIEAARAGEAGRGFAVVADEVRKLATRTADSTAEITAMITKIQEGTGRAVQSMDAAVTQANEGVLLAHRAGDSVTGIRSEAEQVSAAVIEINHALHEQSKAAQNISEKISDVAHGAVNNSVSADETSMISRNIEEVSAALIGLTTYFKI